MNRILATYILCSVLALLASFDCKKKESGKMEDAEIFAAVYGSAKPEDAKIVLNKVINLDQDADLETVVVIASKGSEILNIIDKEKKDGQETYTKKVGLEFTARNAPAASGDDGLRIIKHVILKPIGEEQKVNSVFVEYLSEDPEGKGSSEQIMIFTDLKRSFDSLSAMSSHDLVKKGHKITYQFTEKNNLVLFPDSPEYACELRYNGMEFVQWYSGYVLPYFLEVSSVKGKTASDACQISLTFRNNGDYSSLTYISVSFPGGGSVEPVNEPAAKTYRPGQRVYNANKRSYMPAEYPLVELTKTNWRALYREKMEFAYKPDAKNPAAKGIFVRFYSRRMNETMQFPPDNSLFSVRDQQGFRAYPVSVDCLAQ